MAFPAIILLLFLLLFFTQIYLCRNGLKALFHGINFWKFGLSFAKFSSIEVDPLTTNIAIYNHSLKAHSQV